MAIDGYERSFEEMVSEDLPRHMAALSESMAEPRALNDFVAARVGVAAICKRLGRQRDFPGCYVLLERDLPVYVGISRSVLKRLRQHVRGQTHYQASLAYRIAADALPHDKTRNDAMKTDAFKARFEEARVYLRSLNVAFVEIDNPLVLYVFEAYCALRLGTSKWNTFETH